MEIELQWVDSLPKNVWIRLAYIEQSAAHMDDLRSTCLAAAHASAAFITRRLFKAAYAAQWPLTYGDIVDNVDALLESDQPPTDPISLKLWKLGRVYGLSLSVGFWSGRLG